MLSGSVSALIDAVHVSTRIHYLQALDSLRQALGREPALAEALAGKGVQVALNKTIVRGDHPLAANDEVAFLPPMSGG